MNKKEQNQRDQKDIRKLGKSFNKIINISEKRERECQKAIEAEKSAKIFKDITPDRYFDLLEIYEKKPPLIKKASKHPLIKSSIVGTAIASLYTLGVSYFLDRFNATEKYQQETLTRYFDEIRDISFRQSQSNTNQPSNIAKTFAHVKTITTLQQLDRKHQETLLDFLIKSKLINSNFTNRVVSDSSDNSKSGSMLISLSNASLKKIDLKKADLSGADLSGADLSGADLSGADLSRADLSAADLSGANLSKANLRSASLRYADLNKAKLKEADLKEARLREANLKEADLRESNLIGANLVGVKLEKANLEKANLEKAKLIGANLAGANLENAQTMDIDLLRANLLGTNIKGYSIPKDASTAAEPVCGPHTYTYAVFTSYKAFKGIECVFVNEDSKNPRLKNGIPKLIWYGEGIMNREPYRHVGQAFYNQKIDRSLTGSSSSVFNEQENNVRKARAELTKNFEIKVVKGDFKKPIEIRIEEGKGRWKETWLLQNGEMKNHEIMDLINNYKPLKQVNRCGSGLSEYTVYPILMRRTIQPPAWWSNPLMEFMEKEPTSDWGIRCVFPKKVVLPGKARMVTAWFGTGVWERRPYYHLGFYSENGYGSVDLCGSSKFYEGKEPYCYKVEHGFLKMKTSASGGFDIDQEWIEKWRN